MIYIAHWKDIVRPEFLNEFVKTGRMLVAAAKSDLLMDSAMRTIHFDVLSQYIETREKMRCCGYEWDGDILRLYGWYKGYLKGPDLMFMTTARPDRKYIPYGKYVDEIVRSGILESDIPVRTSSDEFLIEEV